ncbi:hypothetical protein RIF29_08508 [Crotalaria pallida]|uniref:Uncharacterized protein n=1 Tax=Crotalaria pallida TaxID=3830 RepID=A0AAN9FQW4_CROPI
MFCLSHRNLDMVEEETVDTQKDLIVEKNIATNGKDHVPVSKELIKGRNSPNNKNINLKHKPALSGPYSSYSKVQPSKEHVSHNKSQGPKEVVSTEDKIKQKKKEKAILHTMNTLQKCGITGLETSMLQVWNPSTEAIEVARSQGRRPVVALRHSKPPDKNMNATLSSGMEIDFAGSSPPRNENLLPGPGNDVSALIGKPTSNPQ